jgi:hypothetical protein
MLDRVLHSKLAGFLRSLPVIQVIPVPRVLHFDRGCSAVSVAPGRITPNSNGCPAERDLVGAAGSQRLRLGAAEVGFQATIEFS